MNSLRSVTLARENNPLRMGLAQVVRLRHVASISVLSTVAAMMLTVGPGIASSQSATANQHKDHVPTVLAVPSLQPGQVGGFWYGIGSGTPTQAQLQLAARRYSVVVLNAWETSQLATLKKLNPNITVLVYKDLSSTRSYAVHNGRDDAELPTGVGYAEAAPSWFATDRSGNRIQWSGYAGHWQMQVWNKDYQNRWASNVASEVANHGWDGVLADNDMATLRWYSSAVLAGTTTTAASDAMLRGGLDSLVSLAGKRLSDEGKLLVSNLSDGRLDLARWGATAAVGGAMDETFVHFGTSPTTGFVTDWGTGGWASQTSELAAPLAVLNTRAGPNDQGALRFGYASALVQAVGRVVWSGSDAVDNNYKSPMWFSWQDINLGLPSSSGVRDSSGAWSRPFQHGLVIVNPTSRSVSYPLGRTYCDSSGVSRSGALTVPTHDAALLTLC